MKAVTTLTLYRPSDLIVLAQVETGQQYYTPADVFVFEGTIEEFLKLNPEYSYGNDF